MLTPQARPAFQGTSAGEPKRFQFSTGRALEYWPNLLSFSQATPGPWSGSISPFGATKLFFAIHASANPGAGIVLESRFRTPGRGVFADVSNSWLTQTNLDDVMLAAETVTTNSSVQKGTDAVGGPIIVEYGYHSTAGIAVVAPVVILIEELQIRLTGYTGTPTLRVDGYALYTGS